MTSNMSPTVSSSRTSFCACYQRAMNVQAAVVPIWVCSERGDIQHKVPGGSFRLHQEVSSERGCGPEDGPGYVVFAKRLLEEWTGHIYRHTETANFANVRQLLPIKTFGLTSNKL